MVICTSSLRFFSKYLVQTWFQSCTPEYTNSLAFFPVLISIRRYQAVFTVGLAGAKGRGGDF